MNKRRKLIVALGAAGLFPSAALTQQPKKLARIGWLDPGTATASAKRVEAFAQGLKRLGRVEGITMEFRFAEGKVDGFPQLAREIVGSKPDCIVATGVDATRALMLATRSIPVVMGTIDADPVKEGIIATLARPGGNVTGLTGIAWELAGKRLEILLELTPKAKRVAVLFDPRSPAGHAHLDGTRAAAEKLGVELQVLEAREAQDLSRAFRTMRDARVQAITFLSVGMLSSYRPQIAQMAIQSRLPAIYSNLESVFAGGLMAYSPDLADQFGRAAIFVDKILNGATPANLPVEQPTKFELVLNMKTAKALGITFPQTILLRADRVIE